ncbi:MAG: DUF2279 domain-containing protein [Spirochaetes bacterium]|nr:DUF2279 domain-containing protein [Spirochaetota bacterium]
MTAVRENIPAGSLPSAGGIAFAAEKTDAPAAEPTAVENNNTGDDDTRRAIVRYAYSVGLPALVFAYGFSTWGWAKRDYWLWSDEGYFSHGTRYGGADKLGHLFSHYCAMRMSCAVFNYTEKGSNIRFLYGSLLTMAVGLAIEIGDAYSGYGFCYQDLIFDAIGMCIGGLLSAFPKVDAFVSLSIQYWPSRFFRKYPEKLTLLPEDYSGMQVMANIKLAGFRAVGVNIPNFMRYIMIDIGYGTRGYTSYDRRFAWENFSIPFKSQDIYVGISINMMEVVKDFFKDPGNLACRATQQVFKYYHIPAGYQHRFILKENINRAHKEMNPPL